MNPCLISVFRISSMGVCFSKYDLVVTLLRIVLFGRSTPICGLYLSLPVLYVLRSIFFLCRLIFFFPTSSAVFCLIFSFSKISAGLFMRSVTKGFPPIIGELAFKGVPSIEGELVFKGVPSINGELVSMDSPIVKGVPPTIEGELYTIEGEL